MSDLFRIKDINKKKLLILLSSIVNENSKSIKIVLSDYILYKYISSFFFYPNNAIFFYTKYNFLKDAIRANYYSGSDPDDAILMSLEI